MKLYRLFKFELCICMIFSLALAGCSRDQREPKSLPEPVKAEVAATTALLATISDQEKSVGSQGPSAHMGTPSAEGISSAFTVLFSRLGGGVIYSAEKDGKSYVVHNGKAGKGYSAIGDMAISRNGLRFAHGVRLGEQWAMAIDGREGELFDEVGEPVFSPDSQHVAYEARRGDKWHIVLDGKMSSGCQSYYDKPVFSSDSSKIFYIENTADPLKKRFIVSDPGLKKQHIRDFSGSAVVVSEDRTRVAAVLETGKNKKLIEFSFAEPDKLREGPYYTDIAYIGLGTDGTSLAYAAMKEQTRVLILNGREEPLPDGDPSSPAIRPDKKGAGLIIASEDGSFLHQAVFQDGTKKKRYDAASELTYSSDSSRYAYVARKGKAVFVVMNGKEGLAFDMVVAPMFSPDGKFLIYRARKAGKRFVVVADAEGKVIRQHPSYEMVFQPVFTSDGKSVAYGVKDGNQLIWKVEKLDK